VAYLHLRDSVIDLINATTTPELQPARNLIKRYWGRDLYKCLLTKKIHLDDHMDRQIWDKEEEEIQQEIIRVGSCLGDENQQLDKDDLIVEKHVIHHGAKLDNPLLLVRFLPKSQFPRLKNPIPDLPTAKQVHGRDYRAHIPQAFQEQNVRFYCRSHEKMKLLQDALNFWHSDGVEGNTSLVITGEHVGTPQPPRKLTQETECHTTTPRRRRGPETDNTIDLSPIPNNNNVAKRPRKLNYNAF